MLWTSLLLPDADHRTWHGLVCVTYLATKCDAKRTTGLAPNHMRERFLAPPRGTLLQ